MAFLLSLIRYRSQLEEQVHISKSPPTPKKSIGHSLELESIPDEEFISMSPSLVHSLSLKNPEFAF
jgi:hypothetical protein